MKVAAEVLRKLKLDAEEQNFHHLITCVVDTYPASFDSRECDKIREASRFAGFTEIAMLEEPVTAAMTYAPMELQFG